MLHRPGGAPRARNNSASQAGAPGALWSNGCGRDGRLATRQRIRAPLRLAVPLWRTSQQGTWLRSAATANRRVAVKSRAAGSPHNSPMTAPMPVHLSPSSIAHKASRASRAATWMRGRPSPAGWTRPASRIAMRSWTHSTGLPAASCGSRKPAQPPSRGEAANSSERVGDSGFGRIQRPCEGRGPVRRSGWVLARVWTPAFAGAQSGQTDKAPPATRESSATTRLATHMFCFCSYSRESGSRVKAATRR